jgi:hypothetical protein
MQDGDQAGALAKVDQAIAEIGPKVDSHVEGMAAAIRAMGPERAYLKYFEILLAATSHSTAAALATGAIARLARESLEH